MEEEDRIRKAVVTSAPRTLADQFPDLPDLSPFTLWQEIFSDAMADMIVSQSNLYANWDKNNQQFAIDRIDLARFVGVILLSGYHCLPEERHYWSTQHDLGVGIVSSAISRNSFQTMKKYLHVADNDKRP